MTLIRKNVWGLGADWADPILWYARGVKAMKSRGLNQRTSWKFYGAIHGIDQPLWTQLGILSSADEMPSQADIAAYWSQCQHGSWFFLPWHRGYLIAFEGIVRDAIVKLGGPADWTLPYWNYFNPGQNALPPAFASPQWPDGATDNPLFVPQRYGPQNDGNVVVPVDQINLAALGDPNFAGDANGGDPGFGGVRTGFEHGGQTHGGIETQPHDWVHGLVGGSDPNSDPNNPLPGLMSNPDTAGLDPIFWLHHTNIDRLWEVWREHPTTDMDPTESNWVNGPAATGGQAYQLPMADGSSWTYTPGQMSDLSKLGYSYDDFSAPAQTPQAVARLTRLGVSVASAKTHIRSASMTAGKSTELAGASAGPLQLSGSGARASVTFDPGVRHKISASLTAANVAATGAPDRVFLNLENVKGLDDSVAFNVYVNLPDGADPLKHPENRAGGIALFGVRKATKKDGEHAGNGLTFVLDISHVIDALHLQGKLGAAALDVRLVPVRPVPEQAAVSISRIRVFRQGK